jgi:hypothetical protein
MLKKPTSFVLGSSKSSTYPRGYASGFDSPAALLDGFFEHPYPSMQTSDRVLTDMNVSHSPRLNHMQIPVRPRGPLFSGVKSNNTPISLKKK